jgi:hypothetical protein
MQHAHAWLRQTNPILEEVEEIDVLVPPTFKPDRGGVSFALYVHNGVIDQAPTRKGRSPFPMRSSETLSHESSIQIHPNGHRPPVFDEMIHAYEWIGAAFRIDSNQLWRQPIVFSYQTSNKLASKLTRLGDGARVDRH